MRNAILKILLLLPILLGVAACDPGCVEADEFDTENIIVNAKPTGDGIMGRYNKNTGGQVAMWHETGLRTNGEPIRVLISGAWGAWEQTHNIQTLKEAPFCNMCVRKEGFPNCICKEGEEPQVEKDDRGEDVMRSDNTEVNCSSPEDQKNPEYCTCMYQDPESDIIYPYLEDSNRNMMHYYIALDYQKKDGSLKIADEQKFCKYGKGMGLYLGMFGTNGFNPPIRAYHLYATEEICDIKRNHEGLCIDDSGNDRTKYFYQSPNNKIFVKDDLSGNNGNDISLDDDILHSPKEVVKAIIYDRYYDDNFGYYQLNFISGVQRGQDRGILEYIVGSVEDVVLGKIDDDTGKRDGGIVKFMYNAIVKDSTFILLVRLCLILYITIFGFKILSGTGDLSRKEIMSRMMKIGLVIFFTTPTSWNWYNDFVIGFFKDGMDYIISMFMSLSDDIHGENTSMLKIAQMLRDQATSNATRFSYADTTIKKLLSAAVTKKIWGLILSSIFGLLYIIVIYALIFYFIYISIVIALTYISSLLKLVLVLSLGPLFIITSLFEQSSIMFKKWMAYMAARSFEIICVFVVFYMFLTLIDKGFTDLLTIRVCSSNLAAGFFSFGILSTENNRSLIEWLTSFVNIGLLIFLLQITVSKIPGVSNALVSVGGTQSGTGKSAFGDAAGGASGLASNLFSHAVSLGGAALKGAIKIAPTSLIGMGVNAIGKAIPFRGPRGWIRDSMIDGAIKQATKEVGGSGKVGASLDTAIRNRAMEILAKKGENKKNLLGINNEAILKRFDKKLVQEPLKDFIKQRAKQLKGKGTALFGKEMTDRLKLDAKAWAEKSLAGGSGAIDGHLQNMKSFMKNQGAYGGREAAEKLSRADGDRYLQYLERRRIKGEEKDRDQSGFARNIRKGYDSLRSKERYNPKRNEGEFLRHRQMLDKTGVAAAVGRTAVVAKLDQMFNRDKIKKETNEEEILKGVRERAAKEYDNQRMEIAKRHAEELENFNKELASSRNKSELISEQNKEIKDLNRLMDTGGLGNPVGNDSLDPVGSGLDQGSSQSQPERSSNEPAGKYNKSSSLYLKAGQLDNQLQSIKSQISGLKNKDDPKSQAELARLQQEEYNLSSELQSTKSEAMQAAISESQRDN